MIAIPSSAYASLLPASWQIGATLAIVAFVAVMTARVPKSRIVVGVLVAMTVAAGLVWANEPIIDCDYWWWTIECMLRP